MQIKFNIVKMKTCYLQDFARQLTVLSNDKSFHFVKGINEELENDP